MPPNVEPFHGAATTPATPIRPIASPAPRAGQSPSYFARLRSSGRLTIKVAPAKRTDLVDSALDVYPPLLFQRRSCIPARGKGSRDERQQIEWTGEKAFQDAERNKYRLLADGRMGSGIPHIPWQEHHRIRPSKQPKRRGTGAWDHPCPAKAPRSRSIVYAHPSTSPHHTDVGQIAPPPRDSLDDFGNDAGAGLLEQRSGVARAIISASASSFHQGPTAHR